MEAKILVHATYNTDPHLSLLQNSLSESKKNDFFIIFEYLLIFLTLLFIIHVLCKIIEWIYLNYFQISTDNTNTIYNKEKCPICLNEFTAPIRVNCGHAFCMECLLSYITNNPTIHNCPLCRNFIRDFECLNRFNAFEAKERAHEMQLKQALRNYIPQQSSNLMALEEKHILICLTVIYSCIMCIMYCIVELL